MDCLKVVKLASLLSFVVITSTQARSVSLQNYPRSTYQQVSSVQQQRQIASIRRQYGHRRQGGALLSNPQDRVTHLQSRQHLSQQNTSNGLSFLNIISDALLKARGTKDFSNKLRDYLTKSRNSVLRRPYRNQNLNLNVKMDDSVRDNKESSLPSRPHQNTVSVKSHKPLNLQVSHKLSGTNIKVEKNGKQTQINISRQPQLLRSRYQKFSTAGNKDILNYSNSVLQLHSNRLSSGVSAVKPHGKGLDALSGGAPQRQLTRMRYRDLNTLPPSAWIIDATTLPHLQSVKTTTTRSTVALPSSSSLATPFKSVTNFLTTTGTTLLTQTVDKSSQRKTLNKVNTILRSPLPASSSSASNFQPVTTVSPAVITSPARDVTTEEYDAPDIAELPDVNETNALYD